MNFAKWMQKNYSETDKFWYARNQSVGQNVFKTSMCVIAFAYLKGR